MALKKFKQSGIPPQRDKFLTEAQVRAIVSGSLTNYTQKGRIISGHIESGNFVEESTGWKLSSDGEIKGKFITAPRFQTKAGVDEGIKMFSNAPDTITGNTDTFLPTANSEPASPFNGVEWTNPSNAQSVSGTYATAVQGGAKYSIWKSFSNLQAAIPSGVTITGISVRCFASVDTVAEIPEPKFLIQLSKGGDNVVGVNRVSDILTTTDAFVSTGGVNDLWGSSWARSDFDLSFGVMITGTGTSTPNTTYQLDYIQVIVHYERSFIDDSGETIADSFFQFWNTIGNTLLYLKRNTLDFFIDKANLIIKGTLTVEPQEVIFGNTSANFPTANAEPASPFGGAMWTNPVRAHEDDSLYSTAVTAQKWTIWHKFVLEPLIPDGATITGIEVKVNGKVSSGTGGVIAQLTKDASTVVGINKAALNDFTTSDSVITFGGSDDLWPLSGLPGWSAKDFGENFGVMLTQNPISAVTVSVDYITVKVYYTLTGDNIIKGNIIPNVNGAYALGSPTKKFREIHLEGLSSFDFTISDVLQHSNDSVKITVINSQVYTKIKEILLNIDIPASRIKFDMRSNQAGGSAAQAKIYKNGVAIGIEQDNNVSGYATKTEDFTGFVSGDLIQIFGKVNTANNDQCHVKNFRFHYDKDLTQIHGINFITSLAIQESTSSLINQDP